MTKQIQLAGNNNVKAHSKTTKLRKGESFELHPNVVPTYQFMKVIKIKWYCAEISFIEKNRHIFWDTDSFCMVIINPFTNFADQTNICVTVWAVSARAGLWITVKVNYWKFSNIILFQFMIHSNLCVIKSCINGLKATQILFLYFPRIEIVFISYEWCDFIILEVSG